MLKRAKAEAEEDAASEGGAKKQARDLSRAVLDSSRDIWLAGLGAFSRAQAEGTKVFDKLVRQGRELETRTRRAAADTANVARDVATEKAKEMQKAAGGTWDKLEQVFEDRVARALAKLGVQTQDDVRKLAARVDALSDALDRLVKRSEAGALGRSAAGAPLKGAGSARPRKAPPKTAASSRTARKAPRKTAASPRTARKPAATKSTG